jgi:hypothetical protein
MSAVAAIPNLSQLVAWPTEHLTEAADHWETVAGRSYGLANQVWCMGEVYSESDAAKVSHIRHFSTAGEAPRDPRM